MIIQVRLYIMAQVMSIHQKTGVVRQHDPGGSTFLEMIDLGISLFHCAFRTG